MRSAHDKSLHRNTFYGQVLWNETLFEAYNSWSRPPGVIIVLETMILMRIMHVWTKIELKERLGDQHTSKFCAKILSREVSFGMKHFWGNIIASTDLQVW